MFLSNNLGHALIAIYGDNSTQDIARAITTHLSEEKVKTLAPTDIKILGQAAQNSVLVIIGITGKDDPHLEIGAALQENNLVVADIIAFCFEADPMSGIKIMARGFDGYVTQEDAEIPEFKQYLTSKIIKGVKRMEGIIEEEEYRRLSDALSTAPVSMIIFDADKRAVYVSDHYFRAYPKIAPRLIRGLRVYDAFEMMVTEEGVPPEDPRYAHIKQFWLNLDGNVEFTLDDGVSYRLKATKLPSNRGTVITAQNITGYRRIKRGSNS